MENWPENMSCIFKRKIQPPCHGPTPIFVLYRAVALVVTDSMRGCTEWIFQTYRQSVVESSNGRSRACWTRLVKSQVISLFLFYLFFFSVCVCVCELCVCLDFGFYRRLVKLKKIKKRAALKCVEPSAVVSIARYSATSVSPIWYEDQIRVLRLNLAAAVMISNYDDTKFCQSPFFIGILAVSAILFIVMGILVTMFFSQIIDNFIYKVNVLISCFNSRLLWHYWSFVT